MRNLIDINQRYKSSTRIDSEFSNYQPFFDDFILHGTAINVIDTISRDFAGSEQRAYTIKIPHGPRITPVHNIGNPSIRILNISFDTFNHHIIIES